MDNGIASLDGVAHARAHGLKVLVTDHHLPAKQGEQVLLPDADVIVNPNQPDCGFASKALAGVGVMFYVLLALRAELRSRGCFDAASQPKLDALLDLVALGTVADVVKLDANNRRLVAQGLKRIRSGRMQPGVAALFSIAARDPQRAAGFDFGFALGPRINAAGRLSDMTLGIECLLTDDAARAAELASLLDGINRQRREVEAGMREQAEAWLGDLMPRQDDQPPSALCLFDARFHEGVVGIVAGAAEGPVAPADLRLRARQRRAAQGLGPLDRRLSLARCAGPGGQAPSGAVAPFRRPRDGGRLQHRRGRLRRLRPGVAGGGQRMAGRRHVDAPAAHRRAAGASSGSTPRPSPCSMRRSGDRASRRRCSATRSRCCSSVWSATST